MHPSQRPLPSPRSTTRRRLPWAALCALGLLAGVAQAADTAAITAITSPTAASAASGQGSIEWVGRFGGAVNDWRDVQIKSELAKNRFGYRRWDGVDALEVHSSASMSLKARPLTVDLDATPVLCWRWRIAAPIASANMQQRQGDDYAARVYVSFKLPDAAIGWGLRTQLRLGRAIWGPDLPDAAVNYVWDNRHPVGTEQANAYTDRAMMVVLRSGDADARQWVVERRDVKADVARLFAAGAQPVQLAVTADTDNTRETAHAGFADFHFVPAAQACQFPS